MSAETGPEEDRLQKAREFLGDVFPDAVAIVPANVEGSVGRRMDQAGLGLAEILLDDGSIQHATFVFNETPIIKALDSIWVYEQAGELPAGSHESAVDSIINGEFYEQWAAYLPW